jgi:hypothetical protein
MILGEENASYFPTMLALLHSAWLCSQLTAKPPDVHDSITATAYTAYQYGNCGQWPTKYLSDFRSDSLGASFLDGAGERRPTLCNGFTQISLPFVEISAKQRETRTSCDD